MQNSTECPANESDEALYHAWFDGNEHAVDELCRRYGDRLTHFIAGYIGDIHEAEDLMIESFAQMFVKQRPIKENRCFRAYLYKTARNLALRHQKRNLLHLSLDALNFELLSEASAEASLINNEKNNELCSAMQKLKSEYREALYLIYFENMNEAAVGQIMGKSRVQVQKLAYHGKKRLKEFLGKEYFYYENQ